jgi:protein SCO1/2
MAWGGTLLPPDSGRTIGGRIPFAGFVDENGNDFSPLETDAGPSGNPRPWIVSPMYTRCPHTCSAITTALRSALQRSALDPAEYRILSFSFDPHETAAGLQAFRARMRLPAEWLTLRARDPAALDRTLAGLDFRTITVAGNEFEHPNLVAVLAPDMRLTGYIFGINFSSAELARAVRRARAGVSAFDAWRAALFFFAAVGFLVSALLFGTLVARRRARARRAPPAAIPGDA